MNGDGDCLFRAILEQLEFDSKLDKLKYCPVHFHRQMVYHFIRNCEQLYEVVKQGITENYGLPEDPNEKRDDEEQEAQVGPFSIVGYMKYILGSKKWGDSICLILIASMWCARISVVLSRSLGQLKFRHDLPLEQADLILVYNNNELNGHYTGVIRSNENIVLVGKLRYSKKYNINKDVKARLLRADPSSRKLIDQCDDSFIIMMKSESEELHQHAKMLAKMKKMMEKVECFDYSGEERRPKGREKKEERPVHSEKDIQEYEAGEKHCVKCDQDFPTTAQLQRHLDKFHMYQFPYRCEDCGRGLSTKAGYDSHIISHEQGEKKFKCTECDTGFGVKRSLKQHMDEMHSKDPDAEEGKKKYTCRYCSKEFFVKKNIVSHEKRCPENPDRKALTCPICGEAKWYSIGSLNTHKKNIHNLG